MQRIKQILNDLLDTGYISADDYVYLQRHREEAKETHNIELIELATNTEETKGISKVDYKFNKVLF